MVVGVDLDALEMANILVKSEDDEDAPATQQQCKLEQRVKREALSTPVKTRRRWTFAPPVGSPHATSSQATRMPTTCVKTSAVDDDGGETDESAEEEASDQDRAQLHCF